MLLSLEKGRQLRMRRGLWGLPLRGPGGSKGATPPWLLGSLAQSLDGKVEAHLQVSARAPCRAACVPSGRAGGHLREGP